MHVVLHMGVHSPGGVLTSLLGEHGDQNNRFKYTQMVCIRRKGIIILLNGFDECQNTLLLNFSLVNVIWHGLYIYTYIII